MTFKKYRNLMILKITLSSRATTLIAFPGLTPWKLSFARWAEIKNGAFKMIHTLEKRLLFLFIAIWTNPERWLFRIITFFSKIRRNTRSEILKFILVFSLRPVFKLHYFFLRDHFFLATIPDISLASPMRHVVRKGVF